MSRILVVEDNIDILTNVVDYLALKNCTVDSALDGVSALHFLQKNEYDILVLDVALPKMDGFTLCKTLRDQQYTLPIIMLTARDTLYDKEQGFLMGADDYLVKPFALSELWLRILAILKRSKRLDRTQTLADLTVDLGNKSAKRGGVDLNLNPKCFRILEILLRHSPQVVSRETLLYELWQDEPPDTNSLKTHMYLLREKLDRQADKPLLHTVHGVGYRLALED